MGGPGGLIGGLIGPGGGPRGPCDPYRVEPFCKSCPTACRELAMANIDGSGAHGPCLDTDYASGTCTEACNNLVCLHDGGDCSLSEVTSKCETEQAALNLAQSIPAHYSPNASSTGSDGSGSPLESLEAARRIAKGAVDVREAAPCSFSACPRGARRVFDPAG